MRVRILIWTSSQSEVWKKSYGPPKSRKNPNFGNFETSKLGVLRQNVIWVLFLWPCIDKTIRGKVVASPKSMSWWVFWVKCSSLHQKYSNYALINLLFGLCRSIWIIDLLVTLPSPHLRTPTRPSTSKVQQTKERAPTPYPFVVFTFDSHLNLLGSLRAHH